MVHLLWFQISLQELREKEKNILHWIIQLKGMYCMNLKRSSKKTAVGNWWKSLPISHVVIFFLNISTRILFQDKSARRYLIFIPYKALRIKITFHCLACPVLVHYWYFSTFLSLKCYILVLEVEKSSHLWWIIAKAAQSCSKSSSIIFLRKTGILVSANQNCKEITFKIIWVP